MLLLLTERLTCRRSISLSSDARLVADLSDASSPTSASSTRSAAPRSVVARMPVGHSLVAVHRRLHHRGTRELRLVPPKPSFAARPMPFRGGPRLLHDRSNYIRPGHGGGRMFTAGLRTGGLDIQLAELMRDRFGISRW